LLALINKISVAAPEFYRSGRSANNGSLQMTCRLPALRMLRLLEGTARAVVVLRQSTNCGHAGNIESLDSTARSVLSGEGGNMDIPASDTIEFTAALSQRPALEPNINFTTFLGIFIAFSAFLLGRGTLQPLCEWIGLSQYACWALTSSADKIIYATVLLGMVVFVERRSIRSVGLVPLTRSDLGLGLALFAAIVIVGIGFSLLVHLMFPGFIAGVASEAALSRYSPGGLREFGGGSACAK
jgi:hypothetical protein